MKNVLAMFAAAALLAGPQPALAEPIQVTYDDAVTCAALDTVLAMAFLGDDKASADDKETGTYLATMADKWTTQAGAAHPQGQEAASDEIASKGADLLIKLGDTKTDEALAKQISDNMQMCGTLEESAYGGRDGLVN